MDNHDFRRIERQFTIVNGGVITADDTPLDTNGLTLVAVVCPASIGSAATMTFKDSGGDVTGNTDLLQQPDAPTVAADYSACLKNDGSTAAVTLTLAASKTIQLDNDDKGYAMGWRRWLQPTVNADPGANVTFTAVLRQL